MRNKNKQIGLAILLLSAVLFTVPLKAQVTVGAQTAPHSTLEVVALPDNAGIADGVMVPRLTLTQLNNRSGLYGVAQTGAMVYVTDTIGGIKPGYSDQITCTGLVYWSGDHWVSDCNEPEHYVIATSQPKAFSFYEQGTEPVVPLVFIANGSSAITYQWYKIVGKNINFRVSVPCTAADGAGFNTSSFTPSSVEKGSTLIAANNDYYKYFCVAKNNVNDSVASITVEVAVGCGGNDMFGNWISFMCFNLGATNQTIASQKNTSLPQTVTVGRSANERTTYGDLFQWGRIADGHENRNGIALGSTGSGANDNIAPWNATTPPTYENGAVLGLSGQTYPYQQVTRGTTYYGKFITTAGIAPSENWYSGSQPSADLLWRESAFPSNDPCQHINADGTTYSTFYPAASTSIAGGTSGTGWRIPNQLEWASLYRGGNLSGSLTSAYANTWSWYQLNPASANEGTNGYEIKPDGVTTTLFLPANGHRNGYSGNVFEFGSNGYYWSSTLDGVRAYDLAMYPSALTPININSRSFGMALRCIKN